MSEYYIKQPDTDNTRGPLSIEQLVSLAESGFVTEDTLIYDELTEKWKPLSSFTDLIPMVFPQKRKLTINKEEAAPTEKEVTYEVAVGNENPDISAEKILAAASGDTQETKHIGNLKRSREKAAELAIPGIGALLLITAFVLLYPAKDLLISSIQSENYVNVFKQPLVLIGLLDLVLGALVFMGVTSIFSFIRIISAVTFGFTTYLFWAWENPFLIMMGMLMSWGLFTATVSIRYFWMILSLGLGVIGATTLAYSAFAGILSY